MNETETTYWLYKLLRSFGTKNIVNLTSRQASRIMAKKVYLKGVSDEWEDKTRQTVGSDSRFAATEVRRPKRTRDYWS